MMDLNLSISVLACRFPPIILPGSSRLEAAKFTASGPFCPLCKDGFKVLKTEIASLWQACALDKYWVRGGFHAIHCQMQLLCPGGLWPCSNTIRLNQLWGQQAAEIGHWGPGTSGVSSTSISDFNTVRVSTTNQIRQVVSVVSLKAPPILATFNFNIIFWHTLSWSRGQNCPTSQLCVCWDAHLCYSPAPLCCLWHLQQKIGWRWWDSTLLVSAQHPHISLPWLLKNLLTGLIFTGAGLRNKIMRNFSCLCWSLPKLMLLLCFSRSFLAVS